MRGRRQETVGIISLGKLSIDGPGHEELYTTYGVQPDQVGHPYPCKIPALSSLHAFPAIELQFFQQKYQIN